MSLLVQCFITPTCISKIWKEYKSKGWSNFSREDYRQVIASIKEALKHEIKDEKSLWKIEYYWPGHQ